MQTKYVGQKGFPWRAGDGIPLDAGGQAAENELAEVVVGMPTRRINVWPTSRQDDQPDLREFEGNLDPGQAHGR